MDKLTEQLDNLKIKSTTNKTNEVLLCVDILNYVQQFLNKVNHWDLDYAIFNVGKFIELAGNNGFRVEVFIDARMKTEETLKTWRDRREKEVLSDPISVPCNLSKLFGELFAYKGVKVHYSLEEDNDDTIATFAYLQDGFILSGDKDFLCYDQQFNLFSKFYYKDNKLQLERQDNNSWKIGKIFRKVLKYLPKTSTDWAQCTLGQPRK